MELFENFDVLLKTFWFVAIPSSLIFLIQTIMTFLGSDGSDGLQADFDGELSGSADTPFQLFSLRNLINFLLGFSWCGISFYNTIQNPIALLFISLLVGILFVALFFLIITQIQRLAEDNTFKLSETIEQSAEVYLTIPAQMSGKGKVLISIRGSVHELDAMTQGDRIESGIVVKVSSIETNNILIVKSI